MPAQNCLKKLSYHTKNQTKQKNYVLYILVYLKQNT